MTEDDLETLYKLLNLEDHKALLDAMIMATIGVESKPRIYGNEFDKCLIEAFVKLSKGKYVRTDKKR